MIECMNKEKTDITAVSVFVSSIFAVASVGILVWIFILLDKVGCKLGGKIHEACRYICIAIVVSFLFPGIGTIAAIVLLSYASKCIKLHQ